MNGKPAEPKVRIRFACIAHGLKQCCINLANGHLGVLVSNALFAAVLMNIWSVCCRLQNC